MLFLAAIVTTCAWLPQISAFERGQDAFWERDFRLAINQLTIASKADPSNPKVHLLLARALIEAGRIPEAIGHLQTAAKNESNAEARFAVGEILQQLALARQAELRRIAPDSPELDELAGRQFELQGRLDDALQRYKSAAAKDAQRGGIHFLIGNLLWRQRNLPAAEAELRNELERNPHHGMANLRLGEVLLATDRAQDAVVPLERAVAVMSTSSAAHRELGKAYRKVDRPQNALREWKLVAAARPNDDQVHFLLGSLYKQLGDSQAAAREMKLHRDILMRRNPASIRN